MFRTLAATGKTGQAPVLSRRLDDEAKARALPVIAEGFAEVNDWHSANVIINEHLRVQEDKASTLCQVLVAYYTRGDRAQQKRSD